MKILLIQTEYLANTMLFDEELEYPTDSIIFEEEEYSTNTKIFDEKL